MKQTKAEMMQGVDDVVSSKVVQSNTVAYSTTDGRTVYRLHNTDIVTVMPNGDTMLHSGGWRTPTTKERINRFIPSGWHVYTDKGTWYVSQYHNPNRWVFNDGMVIVKDGGVAGAGMVPDTRVLKEIKKYAKGYMVALEAGDVGEPGPGDCWYCATMTEGRSLGEAFGDTSHILSHMEERYYVPSLMLRAIDRFPVSQVAMAYLGAVWGKLETTDRVSNALGDIAVEQLHKSLYRYLKSQFGYQA